MLLKNQVCSLELSKRLKELGVKQESLFYWIKAGLNVSTCEENWQIEYIIHNLEKIPDHMISAFTVAELGEILPHTIKATPDLPYFQDETADFDLYYNKNGHPFYKFDQLIICLNYDENETEANDRAKMLIYLIENNLIEVPIQPIKLAPLSE